MDLPTPLQEHLENLDLADYADEDRQRIAEIIRNMNAGTESRQDVDDAWRFLTRGVRQARR